MDSKGELLHWTMCCDLITEMERSGQQVMAMSAVQMMPTFSEQSVCKKTGRENQMEDAG